MSCVDINIDIDFRTKQVKNGDYVYIRFETGFRMEQRLYIATFIEENDGSEILHLINLETGMYLILGNEIYEGKVYNDKYTIIKILDEVKVTAK